MPPRFRSHLLAFALAAIVFACIAPAASARLDGPPRRERPKPVPTLGQRAAKVALRAVGVPYRWGGTSPSGGFDCSGLVYWAYGKVGVEVPHSSYALAGIGRRIGRPHLKPGDVLVFSGYGHVGLFVGRGRMVHAPYSGRTVEIVPLGRSHYGSRLVGARRLVT
jgi:cell wall-associated NlpC family hydrolase